MPGGGGGGRVAAAAAALALSATLTACGTTAQEPDRQSPRAPSIAEQQQAVGAPIAEGFAVSIPSLGVQSTLIRLGLNPDGTVSVPPLNTPEQVGVYDRGPMPGEVGPAVLLAHVNGAGRPGAFARLADLREGDVVDTTTPRGVVRYEVYRVATYPKNAFRTAEVYSDTQGPELRLVTCTGDMDSTGRNYVDNLVVFARVVD